MSNTELESYTRVLAGAVFLDEIKPGWESSVNLSTLNVADPANCIATQVLSNPGKYDGFEILLDIIDAKADLYLDVADWLIYHGFVYDSDTKGWIDLVKMRQDLDTLKYIVI